MKAYPRRGQMVKGYRYSAPITFDTRYGHLNSGSFPADCIEACSASGSVDDAVEYWRKQLNFSTALEPVRPLVESYLREFGAWDDFYDPLAGMDMLADRVLWIACCDIREQGEWFGLCH